MKIAINISPIRGKHQYRGIGIYTKLLVKALREYKPEHEYILTTKTKFLNVDLIHYPFFDFYFLTLPLIKFKPTVVTIHDTIPLIFPDEYPPGIRGKIKFKLQKFSLNKVKAIITDSEKSKNDIGKYLDLPDKIIKRVYLAADPAFKLQPYGKQMIFRDKYNIKKPYFLYVGDINFNKNLAYLIKTFANFSQNFDLVLVSRSLDRKSTEASVLKKLITLLGIDESVKIISDLPDETGALAAVYSGAFWYIQPSLYEGFGLPVLEAMQCETPVIASTGGSLPEITGQAAMNINPNEIKSLTQVLHRVISMTKMERQSFIDRGKAQAEKFSWERTALETTAVYESVLKP